MRQQMRLITDQNRMLLLALVEPHDGIGDLPHQVATRVRRLQVQPQSDLPQQIQSRACREVNIENLEQARVQRIREQARGGGLTRAHLTGEQTRAGMTREEFEPSPDLLPGRRGEHLFGVRRVAEGRLLEAEK